MSTSLDASPLHDIDGWLDRFRGFWTHQLASLAGLPAVAAIAL